MSATVFDFPVKLELGASQPPKGTLEARGPFVNRMIMEARRWVDESPSAAATFLMAAACRLQQEAVAGITPPPIRKRRRKRGKVPS